MQFVVKGDLIWIILTSIHAFTFSRSEWTATYRCDNFNYHVFLVLFGFGFLVEVFFSTNFFSVLSALAGCRVFSRAHSKCVTSSSLSSSSSTIGCSLLPGRLEDRLSARMVERTGRKQCVLLLVLAITTPCHVSIASPVSSSGSSAQQTTQVELLMPSVQPQVVRPANQLNTR